METMMMNDERLRSRRITYKSISAGTFLICLGIILLLNTTGRLDWSVWLDLALLWPILLISAGMRMIFVRTPLHWLSLTGPVLVVMTTIWVAGREPGSLWHWRNDLALGEAVAFSCPPVTGEAGPARIDLGFEAGTLRLASDPATTGPGLSGSMRWAGEEPRRACGTSGNLRIGRSSWASRPVIVAPFRDMGRQWETRIAAGGPIDMSLRLAATEADLDLRHLDLADLDLETAASSIVIHLGPPRGVVPVRIDGGVSRIEFKVPEGTCFTVDSRHRFGFLEVADARTEAAEGRRHRGPRFVTAQACGAAEHAPGQDGQARYEIRYEIPISSVSVDPEPAGA